MVTLNLPLIRPHPKPKHFFINNPKNTKTQTLPNSIDVPKSLSTKCNSPGANNGTANTRGVLSEMVEKRVNELLNKEENKDLLNGLEKASQRVELAKKELEEIKRQEVEAMLMRDHINLLESRTSEIAECQKDISEARVMIEEAERSLATGGAGSETIIEENEERLESIKAAFVSALTGSLVGLPVVLTRVANNGELVLPLAITFVSCALFGVTFRYVVRRDLVDFHLKTGVCAAFGFVKGLATLDGGVPLELDTSSFLSHASFGVVYVSEDFLIFLLAAAVLDLCMKGYNIIIPNCISQISKIEDLDMALSSEQTYDEIFQAQSHIWNHIFNFINSFSLKCAIQLGIPDIIHKHGKPMPISDLVEALSINNAKADCLHRLMRLLVRSGFFIEKEEGYVLTPSSHLLLRDNPFSVTPLLETMLDPCVTEPWHQFSNWFKTDSQLSLFESYNGRSLWGFSSNQPKFNNSFNEAMASDARLVSSFVLGKYKEVFEGVDSLVDVGGGTGSLAKEIAKAFPNMSCIVLDLPHVIDGLVGDANFSFVAGDMFGSLPKANVFLLKWILHDWSDVKCVEILKRCKEGFSSNGKNKVIIMDMVVNEERKDDEVETQLFYDMHLMTLLKGKQRNEKEWAKLFVDAGFTNYKILNVLGVRSLIELHP